MQEQKRLLQDQAARHAGFATQDAVKLLYQAEFGGGHLLTDRRSALKFLRREASEAPKRAPEELFEPIGGGFCRLQIGALRGENELLAAWRLFCEGASRAYGSKAGLLARFAPLRCLAAEGGLPFGPDELGAFLSAYEAQGCPMLSHSDGYRLANAPAYRVLPEALAALFPLCVAVERRLLAGKRTVLAIDGLCGSGKSTVAGTLARLYGASLVRMDDFFLPPELRTRERLDAPGGNIHHERFLAEVAPGLLNGEAFEYRPFDCSDFSFGRPVAVPKADLTIVEGSYSQHPDLRRLYDLTAFLYCAPETQLARIAARDGAEWLRRFISEWIPLENAYFSAFSVKEQSDFRIET
ncbi:MAG: hypothetical protein LBD02_05625 [Christensenellaceae bacterium]|nr:hypothetical protein [Christensenellaceae bacterium]